MRFGRRKPEERIVFDYDMASFTLGEMAAMQRAFPALMVQLEAKKQIAQQEFEESQKEHVRLWLESFRGIEG